MSSETHAAYLRTDGWKATALHVRDRDANQCKLCNMRRAQAVHHLTYDPVYMAREMRGDQRRGDYDHLISVCHWCHKEAHKEHVWLAEYRMVVDFACQEYGDTWILTHSFWHIRSDFLDQYGEAWRDFPDFESLLGYEWAFHKSS